MMRGPYDARQPLSDDATFAERLDAMDPTLCPELDIDVLRECVEAFVRSRKWARKNTTGRRPGRWSGDTVDNVLARHGITLDDNSVLWHAYERETRRIGYAEMRWTDDRRSSPVLVPTDTET